jgi:hypothetical protein
MKTIKINKSLFWKFIRKFEEIKIESKMSSVEARRIARQKKILGNQEGRMKR